MCVSGWVRVYTLVCGLVKNLRSSEGKRLHENGSQVFTPAQAIAGCMFFQHLFRPSPPVCVCCAWISHGLHRLIIICSFSGWKKQTEMCLPFTSLEHSESAILHQFCTFMTRGVGDISRRRFQDNQARTFTRYFSLHNLLRPPFRLSLLVYLRLYSLESLYTTAKSQEPDCFHVLGFIAGFLSR